MISSREKILKAIKYNQPEFIKLELVKNFVPPFDDVVEKFKEVFTGIGGNLYEVSSNSELLTIIESNFAEARRIISCITSVPGTEKNEFDEKNSHGYDDVDLLIIPSGMAVAENGAVWVTDNEIQVRVLPFITQHLLVVVNRKNIVATMHDAYNLIAAEQYGFATFIAGPSRTADIEQSLVLGAHGARTMTVFLMNA